MAMPKYALFTGCTVPARLNAYELSVRKICRKLGIELKLLENVHCCGYQTIESLNKEMAYLMAAHILTIAEKENLDLVALCNSCFGFLSKVSKQLKTNPEFLSKINSSLKELGLEYKGLRDVKHIAQVIYEDVGTSKIQELIEREFNNANIAVHYGCHILRPSDVVMFDNPEFPSTIDELVECLGLKSIQYKGKTLCCGSPLLMYQEDLAFKTTEAKIKYIFESGADAIVTVCPFCHIMLESVQLKMMKNKRITKGVPVLLYTQLLGLALGFGPKSLGFYENKIPVRKFLDKLLECR